MSAQTATAMQPAPTSNVAIKTGTEKGFGRSQEVFDSIAKRAFEIFENNGRWFGNEVSNWLQAESELFHPVRLEIAETDEAMTVRAEVPGFAAQELDIHVEGNRLTIAGKHESTEESEKGRTIYSERDAQEIFRSVELPAEVEGSKVKATLKDGVLNIELSKAAPAKSVGIDAKAAS